ncbi:MAG: hypothetical protein FJW63_07615 [Actinobacteria bacterium]|nr:hypothetical protein [Actinomycetota bacterium]
MPGKVVGGISGVDIIGGQLFIGLRHIKKSLIAGAELVTEENKKRVLSAIRWGAAGGLLLGPLGGVAGLVFGGRTKEVCFALYLTDGRNYLITSDPQTFQAIKAMSFKKRYHNKFE